jgi:phosphoenolpyruvate carboxylase
MTEQGEVISFRYALPAIAHRHLEQVIGATLLAAPSGGGCSPVTRAPDPGEAENGTLDRLALRAMARYRELIDHPGFWDWYAGVTPIEHISHLPIASRPVSRAGGVTGIDNLRAIPWVFAWTQIRGNIPGWFGIGTALLEERNRSGVEGMQRLFNGLPFFRALIENAELELARARMHMLERYAIQAGDDLNDGGEICAMILEEAERSTEMINSISGSAGLLDTRPVIQRTIQERNPQADVLQFLQLELLGRARQRGGADGALRRALFLSINGIAAAMQSTG